MQITPDEKSNSNKQFLKNPSFQLPRPIQSVQATRIVPSASCSLMKAGKTFFFLSQPLQPKSVPSSWSGPGRGNGLSIPMFNKSRKY
ncbi:predicted protein [Botrytis cinerea T4]|uniref:Uncharacterized protein n=1 Tax=Botryotinia fuckeliana (strain T4) TaxID=999810 RepID=G2YXM4_BOTF4|nr:predicted protein [Botrytis cinerea T4]